MKFSHFTTLVRAHITEKSMRAMTDDIYTFVVNGTKSQVKQSVEAVYKVDVVAVNVLNYKPEKKYTRNGVGHSKRFKLAYVRIKKGQSIDLEAPLVATGE